ncbi:hypothetical protein BD410DRAFT_789060 [Rickenella mellea]|uniref:Uncharacterized protein n=1 Tax=Rickenella mellea TaxID=50990 RepID=A0A4Y7Q4Y4_9AGAM|nr:hypothetical protein BD410DRAFT_789060 [Rickenella mellea]
MPNAIERAETAIQKSSLLGKVMNEDRRIRLHPLLHLRKILQCDDTVFKIGDVRMTMLFLVVTLTVSMTVQACTVGFSVYHALTVLNLCWVTMISLMPSTAIHNLLHQKEGEPFHPYQRFHISFCCYLCFVGGVMIWIGAAMEVFDTTYPNCTTYTKYDILGNQIGADSVAFKTSLLLVPGVIALPWVNLMLLYFTYSLFILAVSFAIWMLLVPLQYFKRVVIGFDRLGNLSRGISTALPDVLMVLLFLAILSPTIVIILITERTLAVNNVGNGKNHWTVSQTTFLCIAAIQFLQIVLQGLSKCHQGIPETHPDANAEPKCDERISTEA